MAGRAGLVALLLLSSSPFSGAHTLPYVQESEYCAVSCAAVIGRVTFNGSKPENPPCSNNIAVTSLFACTSKYCSTSDEAQYGLDYINWTCSREGKPSLPEYYAIQLPSPDHISTVSAAQIKKVHFNQTVVPTEDYYRLVYRSTDAKYKASYYDWMFVYVGLESCLRSSILTQCKIRNLWILDSGSADWHAVPYRQQQQSSDQRDI